MSYRDLRNFSEAMRVLGFPKSISLESFRIPNWELMEECLRWLAARVEPDAELAGGAGGKDTVEQRVALVTHAIALFHSSKLSKEGYLIIRSDTTRSQQLNLADCMQKLRNLIRDASVTKREPAPETVEKIRQRHLKAARLRVAVKREESLKRAMGRPPTHIDL